MTSNAMQKLEALDSAGSHRINGFYDFPGPKRISGWAIDRSDPGASVEVRVYRDGQLVATASADKFRADLAKSGLGTGKYGFSIELEEELDPLWTFTIDVEGVSDDGCVGPLRRPRTAEAELSPELRLLQEIFLRQRPASAGAGATEAGIVQTADPTVLADAIDRIEVVLARLEHSLGDPDQTRTAGNMRSLKVLVFVSLILGAASFIVGLFAVLPSVLP